MTILIILLVIFLLFILFVEELYRYVFCRPASVLFTKLFDKKGHEEAYYEARDSAAERLLKEPAERCTVKSARGEELCGFYYPCGDGTGKLAFVVHGYRSEHNWTAAIVYDYYKSRGFDVFAPDHAAHGESEGRHIGFDVTEAEDCLLWLRFLTEKLGPNLRIVLHGFSMGAATVLRMAGRCPPAVKLIVEDSGFRCAKEVLGHQVGPLYGLLQLLHCLIAHINLRESDVRPSLEKCRLPIFFVHGQDDKLVPYQNGPALFESYEGPKACFFPEKTRHIEAMYTEPLEYARRLDLFLDSYF